MSNYKIEAEQYQQLRIVRVSGFLPEHQHKALFNAVCENKQAFKPPGNLKFDVGGTHYLSLSDNQDVDSVREASDGLSQRILGLIPELFSTLRIEPFPVEKIPLTFVNGLNGHRGSPHADESGGRFKLSLLYYFHRVPKVFCGGDLEFFNADTMSPSGCGDKVIAKIAHEDNLLVAFPSHAFHGITEVYCDSNNFADGRFAAIAFLGPE